MDSLFKQLIYFAYFVYYSLSNYHRKIRFSGFTRLNPKTKLEGNNKIYKSTDICFSQIGRGTYISNNSLLSNASIGRFCSIGPRVRVIMGNHPTGKFVSTHPCFFSTLKQAGFTFVQETKFEEATYLDVDNKIAVKIGNDVWISSDVKNSIRYNHW